MIIKKIGIKIFLKKFLKFIPDKFWKYMMKVSYASLTDEKPFISEISLFELKELTVLSDKKYFLNNYRNKLELSGNELSDNIYKTLRYINLSSALEFVLKKDIKGDIAECGCWHGHSLFMLKELLNKYKLRRSIFVFDSFEGGLSEFKKNDLKGSSIDFKEANLLSKEYFSDYELLKEKIKINNLNNIFLNKGWIPQVFNLTDNRTYSFVHIDVDLYEPTLESLKYFFGKVSKGGIIICDDYGYNLFPGAKRAVDEFISSLDVNDYSLFIPFAIGGCLIQK